MGGVSEGYSAALYMAMMHLHVYPDRAGSALGRLILK